MKTNHWRKESKEVLRPAVRFIDAGVPFPRIHVASLSPANKAFVKSVGMEFYSTAHFPRTVELENQRSEWVYIPAIRHSPCQNEDVPCGNAYAFG